MGSSHTEAFAALRAERQAARQAEAQAQAEARALADAARLAGKDSVWTAEAGPQGPGIPNIPAILSPVRQITAKEAEMTRTEQIYTELKLADRMTPGRTPWQTLRKRAEELALTEEPQPEAPTTKEAPVASERSAKAMAPKTSTTKTPEATEVPQVDLHLELVAQLKEQGYKVTPKWSPSKKYAAYKQADGKTLAYVFAQTSSGIKVKAGLEMKELDRAAKKAWLDNSKEAPFSIRGFFTQDTLPLAVEAIKATAGKLAAAKAAKAESAKKPAAKKAPAKKTTKKEAPSIILTSPAEGLVKIGNTALGKVQA